MAENNSPGDVRVMCIMLESLADAVFKSRRYVIRDIGPRFPKYAKEFYAIAADLTAAADKLHDLMTRSMDEEGSGNGN